MQPPRFELGFVAWKATVITTKLRKHRVIWGLSGDKLLSSSSVTTASIRIIFPPLANGENMNATFRMLRVDTAGANKPLPGIYSLSGLARCLGGLCCLYTDNYEIMTN